MSENPLPELFSTFTSEAFRLETLPAYVVAEEQDDLRRYVDGEFLPTHSGHKEWLEALSAWKGDGKRVVRLRLVPARPSVYLNFEIEWGYVYNAQYGEEIYLIGEEDFNRLFGAAPSHDWWMFDSDSVARMNYGPRGNFLGAEAVAPPDDSPYRNVRDNALRSAVTLKEYMRSRRAAPK